MLNKGLLLGEKIKLYNIIRGSISNVSLSYSPQTDIKAGTRVNITVNANGGYQNPWVTVSKNDGTGNVTVSGSGSNRYFTMPKSDVTITAGASVIPTYSVSGSASGGGISFSKTSGIRAGEVITVYLSPNSSYILTSLTSSPHVNFSGSDNRRTFTMPSSNVRVTATFVQYTHRITVGTKTFDNVRTVWGWHPQSGFGSFSPVAIPPYGDAQMLFTDYSVYTKHYTTYLTSNKSDDAEWKDMAVNITRLDTGYTAYNLSPGEYKYDEKLFDANDVGKTIYLKIVKS